MVSLDALIVLVGVIYGFTHPGKEDKINILKKGLKYGFFIGILIGIIGLFSGNVFVAFAAGTVGIIGVVIVAFIISVEFIIGTFIGDLLEGILKN